MEAYLDASDTSLGGFTPVALNQVIWSLAVMGVVPDGSWLAHWCLEARSHADDLNPMALTNTIWGLAKSVPARPCYHFIKHE